MTLEHYSDSTLSPRLDELCHFLCLFKNLGSGHDLHCLYYTCLMYLYASFYLNDFPVRVFLLVYMCIYACFPQAVLNVIRS